MCTSVLRRRKGKTTAAIGLAVRAAGTGKQVVAARFLKTDQSGEVEILKRLPEVMLIPCEKTFGFTWKMTDEVKQEAADYYKSMFETACREAVKRCEKAEDSRSRKIQNNETCDVLLVLDDVMGITWARCAAHTAVHFLHAAQVLALAFGQVDMGVGAQFLAEQRVGRFLQGMGDQAEIRQGVLRILQHRAGLADAQAAGGRVGPVVELFGRGPDARRGVCREAAARFVVQHQADRRR